ncbi:Putative ribonuclease H protein At1g65750 [Linum perenne]
MNLGICSITRAEIRGALEGIKRTWDAGYRRIKIQIDSKAAIAILTDKNTDMSKDWEVKIRHVYREANYAADHLASRGHSKPRGSHCVDLTDSCLAHLLRYDCMGISEPKLISIN